MCNSCTVYQDIEFPFGFDNVFHGLYHVGLLCHITAMYGRSASYSGNIRCRLTATFFIQFNNVDSSTLCSKYLCYGLSDSTTTTRNYGHFTI
jgi:hypothetical protein